MENRMNLEDARRKDMTEYVYKYTFMPPQEIEDLAKWTFVSQKVYECKFEAMCDAVEFTQRTGTYGWVEEFKHSV